MKDNPKPKAKPAAKKEESPRVELLTEGKVVKGGRNHGPSQITERPAPPAPITQKAVAVRDPKTTAVVSGYMQETRGLGSALMAAMSDPAFGADKAREAFEFYKNVRAYESEQAFVADYHALQKDLSHVRIRADRKIEIRAKDAKSGDRTGAVQQSTPYATYAAIMAKVLPLLSKHNFTISAETEPTPDGRLMVRGLLQHITGHKRTTVFPLPAETSGSKNNVQGWGSSQTYGRRYTAIALLNIISHAPEDADTDGHEGNFQPNAEGSLTDVAEVDRVSPEQAAQLRKKIGDVGLPMDKFRQRYTITNVDELPANLFDAAMTALDKHAVRSAKNG